VADHKATLHVLRLDLVADLEVALQNRLVLSEPDSFRHEARKLVGQIRALDALRLQHDSDAMLIGHLVGARDSKEPIEDELTELRGLAGERAEPIALAANRVLAKVVQLKRDLSAMTQERDWLLSRFRKHRVWHIGPVYISTGGSAGYWALSWDEKVYDGFYEYAIHLGNLLSIGIIYDKYGVYGDEPKGGL
jgi:hypothetical protein